MHLFINTLLTFTLSFYQTHVWRTVWLKAIKPLSVGRWQYRFIFLFPPAGLNSHTVHTEVLFLSNSSVRFSLTASFASPLSFPLFSQTDRLFRIRIFPVGFLRPIHAETRLRARTKRHDMYIYPIACHQYLGVTLKTHLVHPASPCLYRYLRLGLMYQVPRIRIRCRPIQPAGSEVWSIRYFGRYYLLIRCLRL